jgi:UDP-N-acetylmuramate--alanine ligase
LDASLVLGGIDVNTGTNAHHGAGAWFLTEADESDGSFSLLEPSIAVVNNIENDHLSSDAELPKLIASFDQFLARLPQDGVAIVGVDNPQSRSIAASPRDARTVTFGIAADADVHAANIRFADLGSSFDVIAGGVCLGSVELGVPGAINIENALAAIAVGRAVDVPFVRIAQALREFRGVRRRFEILAKTPRMIVVDDYAHHPTAVRATIAAARQYHRGPLVVAFQPHRYTRTAYLAPAFVEALRGADEVYLAPVYAASEPPIDGISERSIGEPLAAGGTPVHYVKYVHDLRAVLQDRLPPNALVLMLGAGNITKVARDLAGDVAASAA